MTVNPQSVLLETLNAYYDDQNIAYYFEEADGTAE